MSAPETIAQMAMSQTSATSVIAGQMKATTPAAISTRPSTMSRPQRSPLRAALMPAAMAKAPSTSIYAEKSMTKTLTANPGVSRQIRPNRIPKIPRKPTDHQ